ncbi:MAG: hypothetical protein ISQ10_01405 [Planctomycetes bacterium]|nr:hypothetical protein [Planctomycetota bacterium]
MRLCATAFIGCAGLAFVFANDGPSTKSLTVIPPDQSVDDVSQKANLHELAQGRGGAWDPSHAPSHETLIGLASDRQFLRDVWCLEFAYRPPRTIEVDVPGENLEIQKERVWYLLYRVRNIAVDENADVASELGGSTRQVVFEKDEEGNDDLTRPTTKFVNQSIHFEPHFVFETHEALSRDEGLLEHQDHLDRLVSSAIVPISRREKIHPDMLHDSVSISERPIQPGEERWGVAIWQDIDPRIDFFTVFIYGLTNSIRWRHDAEFETDLEHAPEYERRELECLRLDFYHPGDADHDDFQEVNVVHSGLFERLTLGSRLLEATSRAAITQAKYVQGVRNLGVRWQYFLEPEKENWEGGAGLVPVEMFAKTLAKVESVAERESLVTAFLGEQAVGWMEELLKAVAGPVTPKQDRQRRESLGKINLTPEQVLADPLLSFARIVKELENAPDMDIRRQEAAGFFGESASLLDQISHEVAIARTAALLQLLQVDAAKLQQAGSRRALEVLLPKLLTVANPAEDDPGRVVDRPEDDRNELLKGLFGHDGPELFKRAMKSNEGEEYLWDFRDARQEDIL